MQLINNEADFEKLFDGLIDHVETFYGGGGG